jgi:hypothetical protein
LVGGKPERVGKALARLVPFFKEHLENSQAAKKAA